MLLGARQFFERRGAPTPPLPYDAEVEYLESTGTQRIDTGILASSNIRIELHFRGIPTGSENDFFGNYMRYESGTLIIGFYQHFIFGYLFGSPRIDSSNLGTNEIEIYLVYEQSQSGRSLTVNGNVVSTSSTQQLAPNEFSIFAAGTISGPQKASIKLYSSKIFVDGYLVRDFIPVRFTNEQGVSEGAMYDRANPTVGMNPDGSPRTDGLYRNRGTGAFLWAEKQ